MSLINSSVFIRPTIAEDAPAIASIAARVSVFSDEEVLVVQELLELYLSGVPQEEFLFLSADDGGRVVGFACYGPIALTERNYELNWLATDPDAGRRGVAALLLDAVEQIARERGGRFVNLETSATDAYIPAQAFYTRQGYQVVARLNDYYSDGDDMLIYRKEIG